MWRRSHGKRPAATPIPPKLLSVLWFLLLGRDPDEPFESFAKLTSLKACPPGLVRIVRKATAHMVALHLAARLESRPERERLAHQMGEWLGR